MPMIIAEHTDRYQSAANLPTLILAIAVIIVLQGCAYNECTMASKMDPGNSINVYFEHDGAYPRIRILNTRCSSRGTVWRNAIPLRTIGNFTTSCKDAAEFVRPSLEVIINMACFDPIPEDKRAWKFCVADFSDHRLVFRFWDDNLLAVSRVYCFSAPRLWNDYTMWLDPEEAVLRGVTEDDCQKVITEKKDELAELGRRICKSYESFADP